MLEIGLQKLLLLQEFKKHLICNPFSFPILVDRLNQS